MPRTETRPFFSIITATFNSEKTIRRTLESLLVQDFKDFEYILIDGNSSDQTVVIIKEYLERFTSNNIKITLLSEPDKGIYDAWNKGLSLSSGEWISFLGSDDFYLPEALQIYHKYIINNPTKNYISSKVTLIDETGKEKKTLGSEWNTQTFLRYMNIAHVGSFHHRSLFKGQSFNLSYKSSSDYDFFLRNLKALNPYFINVVTAKMQDGGISNNVNKALKETLKVKIANKLRNKYLCYFDYYFAHFKHFVSGLI